MNLHIRLRKHDDLPPSLLTSVAKYFRRRFPTGHQKWPRGKYFATEVEARKNIKIAQEDISTDAPALICPTIQAPTESWWPNNAT